MSVAPGTRLGSYEVVSKLGAGGMGEVYLAVDTRLDRRVALKALPDHLTADPDRLARFERESKVMASLNHRNVGTIYGVEEVDDRRYLVLEFVDGETLADRLARGAIPTNEALRLARQIAQGLEAAHQKGVVHRDLKPGNIMIAGDVFSFGCVLFEMLTAPAPSAARPSPTPSAPSCTASRTGRGCRPTPTVWSGCC